MENPYSESLLCTTWERKHHISLADDLFDNSHNV